MTIHEIIVVSSLDSNLESETVQSLISIGVKIEI